ncbi:MAG: thiolase family protein [Pseudomonadota bacterium]
METAVILAAQRSPLGKANKGAFIHTRIDDLAAQVVTGLLKNFSDLDLNLLDDFIVGCATPEGEQGLNVARNIGFLANLPLSCPAMTINRLCASSLTAINLAAQAIMSETGELYLVGGIESMSHAPMGGFNPSLNEKLMQPQAPDAYISMGLTAENLVKKYDISREDQDHFALLSHRKAVAAQQQEKFESEIIPIEAISVDQTIKVITKDDGPRADTTLEVLANLKPAFIKDGTVTAGNSSQLTDGAAMLLIASKSFAKKMKLKPLAKIRAMAMSGNDPAFMGIAPVDAIPLVLKKAKMKLTDLDLVELNEAFAAQALAVINQLNLDTSKLNIHGGAIALGHPLGCSGARIMTTLLHAMLYKEVETGLATMCVGGGQAVATIVERV